MNLIHSDYSSRIQFFSLAVNGKTGYAWNVVDALLITEDGGHSWHDLYNPLMRGNWQALATHPIDPDVALLVGETTLYKTVDGGEQWSLILDYPLGIPLIYQLVYDKIQPEKIYALTSDGLFRSDDGGKHWLSLNQSLPKEIQNVVNSGDYESDLVTSHKSAGTVYLNFQTEFDNFHSTQTFEPVSQVYISEDWGEHCRTLGPSIKANQLTLSPATDTPIVSNDNGIFELK